MLAAASFLTATTSCTLNASRMIPFCDDNDNDKDTHKDKYKDKDEDNDSSVK